MKINSFLNLNVVEILNVSKQVNDKSNVNVKKTKSIIEKLQMLTS